MRYAKNYCIIRDSGDNFTYTGKCVSCNVTITVSVPKKEVEAYDKGAYIQNALVSVSKGDREFLISGCCGSCFDKLFKEES